MPEVPKRGTWQCNKTNRRTFEQWGMLSFSEAQNGLVPLWFLPDFYSTKATKNGPGFERITLENKLIQVDYSTEVAQELDYSTSGESFNLRDNNKIHRR